MDPRRLSLLLELSRRGSMRAVAEATGTATSAVSQQLAVLAREAKAELIEPVGRNVRLTPAGKRLAEHAVIILGAIEAARVDLDPGAAPVGLVRIAAFATAFRKSVLPIARTLAEEYPLVRLELQESEPDEALQLLADDQVDLGITYDYNLAPHHRYPGLQEQPLWGIPWGLGVPESVSVANAGTAATFQHFAEDGWIVNSRGTADHAVVRRMAALAGFTPSIAHLADSLDLVQDMIEAGLGVGLLPMGITTFPGVKVLPLTQPSIILRGFALTRPGRELWPPLALVLRLLSESIPESAE